MYSQLTWKVFRRLLSGKGLVFECTSCQNYFLHSRDHRTAFQVIRKCPRRTFFGISKVSVPEPRDPSITPGLPKMIELSHMIKIGARPPPASELKKSWFTFFAFKEQHQEIVNRLQAQHAWRTYEYLKRLNSTQLSEKLTLLEIKVAANTLRRLPNDKLDYHGYLAKELFSLILELEPCSLQMAFYFERYIKFLSLTGETSQALGLFEKKILDIAKIASENFSNGMEKFFLPILKGFAREKNVTELLRAFELAEKNGVVYHSDVHRIMATFFAEQDDVENTKKWYSRPICCQGTSGPLTRPQTLGAILQFCLRNNELEWCKNVFKEALSLGPSKGIWDVVFLWAAGAMGKGVEDVERMIEIMIRRNPKDETKRPNITTINGLVKLAISKNDPYLAERYLSLGLKYGIQPNAQTLLHQLNYRTDAKDLRGAQAAYDALQTYEIFNNEDLPSINKYIRAICTSSEVNFELIKKIINDLDERGKRLEAETVTELCFVYLGRCEVSNFVNILQTNIYHYTMSERGLIRDAFVKFCCNRYNSTLKAWDAYNILRQFFSETGIEQRTQIMNSFFQRRRCDMACHTFGHMRQNAISDRRPVLDTYVACFEGIAKLADREYLGIVHNMLKLDPYIEPNTKLYNALMLAYTSLSEGGRALSFWKDITSRYEGPDYKSLEIYFWACQESNNGSEEARKLFRKLKRMNIDITAPVFAEYLGSLAKDAHWFEVKALLQGMEQEYGLKPDVRT